MTVTQKDSRKSRRRGGQATGPACPSCGVATRPDARFCHGCGAALAAGAAKTGAAEQEPGPQSGQGSGQGGGGGWGFRLAVAGGSVALLGVTVVATVMLSGPDTQRPTAPAPAAPVFDAPAASPGGPPDLSQMTPRAAADRLFNRIMMAVERGDRAEALRFAPMAVQAYGALPSLDRDAHYHLGLIHGVAGDGDGVARAIAALRQGAPDHLLAMVLEHDEAVRSGDRATAARVLAAFPAAWAAEGATGRPEYDAHRNVIERLRAAAARPAPFSAPQPGAAPAAALPAAAPAGAALFAQHCAACHGPAAAGSVQGPPLVHRIYEPGHHDDASFYRAVAQGVRAHHWKFGDMAPVPAVSRADAARIVAYVRGLQRAAGIR